MSLLLILLEFQNLPHLFYIDFLKIVWIWNDLTHWFWLEFQNLPQGSVDFKWNSPMFKIWVKRGNQNVKILRTIWNWSSVTRELIKMLKFEWNMGNRTILVQNVKSIRLLKFGCKGGIHQSTEIKFKILESIKIQNVEVWVHIQ